MISASPGSRSLPRVLIENIEPTVDAGRYPVKRVVGEQVVVSADILKDGHDQIAARLAFRLAGAKSWRTVPLSYDFNPDRWYAALAVDEVGEWEFRVEAWPDEFGTWLDGIRKKLAAGIDVHVEFLEGAALFTAAARRAKGAERANVKRLAALLADSSIAPERRLVEVDLPEVAGLMNQLHDSATRASSAMYRLTVDRPRAAFAAWYELFPRSTGAPGEHGTFASAARQLPRVAALGFDVVYLPPIHPIGVTHRKGRNNSLTCGPDDVGSPWAIGAAAGGHTAVEPALGSIEDFDRLVASAAQLGIEIALDFALQCSPDHPWVGEHPEWFFQRPDGTIQYAENPPKKYQDIYPINFWCADRIALWNACRDIVRFWVEHGVKTFRVDNPHTKPLAFWEWLIAEVKAESPDVVFLAEAFTRPKRMAALAKLGFTQSYSYFTWRNSAVELRGYLSELSQGPVADYFRPNFFANTPDILHEFLQDGGRAAFRIRLTLAATLSPLYGVYSGFELCENAPLHRGSEEYLDSEKYELRWRDWEAAGHINDDIARINSIRRQHGALQRLSNVSFPASDNERLLFFVKRLARGEDDLLIVVNLDPHHVQEGFVHVPVADLGIGADESYEVHDLLTGERYTWRGERNYVRLDPNDRVAHILHVERRR